MNEGSKFASVAVAVVAGLLFGSACRHGSPVGPMVPQGDRFTLAPGQSASVQGTSLSIQFVRVSGDSRCPADALCIQGGDAIVHVRATTEATTGDYELHTADTARAAATHAGIRIELSQLQPYPFSGRTVEPAEYRATFVATR